MPGSGLLVLLLCKVPGSPTCPTPMSFARGNPGLFKSNVLANRLSFCVKAPHESHSHLFLAKYTFEQGNKSPRELTRDKGKT